MKLSLVNNRRQFLKNAFSITSAFLLSPIEWLDAKISDQSHVYWAEGDDPYQNVQNVIAMMGGIERWFDIEDIIVIKPNCQWWNQGTANLSAMRSIIELILDLPGFSGEIIIAENHQKSGTDNRGWSADNTINTDPVARNIIELIDYFQRNGHPNVTKYHWLNSERGGAIINGPAHGDGYVHLDECHVYNGKETPMTYPVFTSSYSGRKLDLKNGVWDGGGFTGQQVKLINLSSLNHHAFGVSASVKNLMGIVDLPGNDSGRFSDGRYNFHSIGLEGMGGALGQWLHAVKQPDLNIITAEWVGWASRIEPGEAVRGRSIIASEDPVALDYWAAKHILHPLTPDSYGLKAFHNPDYPYSPFRHYLAACQAQGIGTMNAEDIELHYYHSSTSVPDAALGDSIKVEGIYPNPVHTRAIVEFFLYMPTVINIVIWNIKGQKIKTIIRGRQLNAGRHRIPLLQCNHFPNGTYIMQIKTPERLHALRFTVFHQ